MRLIDADALYVEVTERYRDIKAGSYPFNIVAYDMARLVENAPTVDAEPVRHGRWLSAYEYAIKVGVTDMERLEEAKKDNLWKFCNDCEQQVKGFYNYCPNCGVKMDEVE